MAMAWSRICSKVITDPPQASEVESRSGRVGTVLVHLYDKALAKESRKW
jgi:hypothetical protein